MTNAATTQKTTARQTHAEPPSAERQSLIENLAVLVVRRYRRLCRGRDQVRSNEKVRMSKTGNPNGRT
jgi:hypothetical protein